MRILGVRPLRLVLAACLTAALATGCHLKGVPLAKLAFSIGLPQTTFKAGDPIPLTLTLKNPSSSPVTVNKRMAANRVGAPAALREVTVEIKDSAGNEFGFAGRLRIGIPGAPDFISLGGGGSVTKTLDIALFYGLSKPGDYTVTATYENTRKGPQENPGETEKDAGAVRTKVTSNTLHFQISA